MKKIFLTAIVLFSLTSTASVAADAPSPNTSSATIPASIEFEGETYKLVETNDLDKTIKGTNITDQYKQYWEQFREDGIYIMTGGLAPIYATYKVADNQFCINYENPKASPPVCRALFKSAKGQYLSIGASSKTNSTKSAAAPTPQNIFIHPFDKDK